MSGPQFRKPPAIERVLSVQFQELPEFDIVHCGLWYDRVKSDFPRTNRGTRLPRIVERFPFQFETSFELGFLVPQLPRVLFASENEGSTRLMQLQPDRLSLNWRRPPGEGDYVPFPETSSRMAKYFQEFNDFCKETQLSTPVVDLCEVCYVNQIDCPPERTAADYLSDVLSHARSNFTVDWLGTPQAASYSRMFDIADGKGRLYVEASVEVSPGESILLKLTGRAPVDNDQPWLNRLSDAHDWVVDGFVALTNEEIRKQLWGQVS